MESARNFDTDRFIESVYIPSAVDSKHLYRVKAEEQIAAGNLALEAAQAFITHPGDDSATSSQSNDQRINKQTLTCTKRKLLSQSAQTLAETERQRQIRWFHPNKRRSRTFIKTLPSPGQSRSAILQPLPHPVSRTKQDASLKERNPNLLFVRMCNDGQAYIDG